MTGRERAARRLKVAQAIAALVYTADNEGEVPAFEEMAKENQEQALLLARAAIKLVDGLLEPVLRALGGAEPSS